MADKDVETAEKVAEVALKLADSKSTESAASTKKSKWEGFKQKAVQLLGGLLMEKNKDDMWTISLGRVSFWLAFLPALAIWIGGNGTLEDGLAVKDIAPNHLTILLTLAGYNFGKKVADSVNKIWGKNDGPG